MGKRTKSDLLQMQSVPLEGKIIMTQRRIREWYEAWDGQVYVSFSGGKDSTVLLHIVREMFPDVEAVFVNTGLEYPEIQKFVKTFDNVTILRPKMRFDEVIKKYGYPVVSKEVCETVSQAKRSLERNDGKYTYRLQKLDGTLLDNDGNKSIYNQEKYKPLLYVDFNVSNKCCSVMKKDPTKQFEKETGKKPFIGTMAEESLLRRSRWLQYGCNSFSGGRPTSNPMSFWTKQDVLRYIKEKGIPIAPVYGEVVEIGEDGLEYENNLFGTVVGSLKTTDCDRTGCVFCGFGCHLDKGEGRFESLKRTHLRQYEYCIGGGEYDGDGIWKPNKQGLGMGHVFDELNEIYGDDFIRYK